MTINKSNAKLNRRKQQMKKEKNRILIIEDEEVMQETLKSVLKKDYLPISVSNGFEGLEELKKESYSTILLDLRLPKMDGIETLKKIKEIDSEIPIIIVSASNDIKSAVECMKLSALDYIAKPFDVEELLAVVEKAQKIAKLQKENRYLKESLKEASKYSDLIGKSVQTEQLRKLIQTTAPTPSTVLITGESGTGKEIVAKEIHRLSNRANQPFVAINCAAIPENLLESELFGHERGAFTGAMERRIGKFEHANLGTIFLDEIGSMPASMQSKLLRVLEERAIARIGGNNTIPVNVRIIAATNIDFENEIKNGKFREDLYYRINVIPIKLEALRERKEDISLFVEYFINKFNAILNKKVKSISPHALSQLMNYKFPGNVRELQNLIERAVVLSDQDTIKKEHLLGINFEKSGAAKPLQDACREFEKNYIEMTLKAANGNQTKAAKLLNIARSTLNSRMESLSIKL